MKIKKLYEEYITPGYSYVLRNDGKLINTRHAHPYIIQSGKMFNNNFTKLFTHVVTSMGFFNIQWLYDNTNNSKTRELIKEFLQISLVQKIN